MSASDPAEFGLERVAALLHERIGLRAEPTLRGRLRRCIRDEAAGRFVDGQSYLASLNQDDALQRLVDRVTVQETAFFRHPEHFDALVRDVLPTLPQPVTIWSAGCANGQEAFSLAMVLEEQGIEGIVIASDVSTAALRRTQAARYAGRELTGLSPERIARHLTPTSEGWEVNQRIRKRVRVVRHNLLDPIPDEMRASRVVFCRNVLIYFGSEHSGRFLDGVADLLPESQLFLGSAETMWPISERFHTVPGHNTFFYRPRSDRARAGRNPARPGGPSRFPPTTAGTARSAPALPAPPVERRRTAGGIPAAAAVDERAIVDALSRTAEAAMAAGDHEAAVVAFRKCAYLTPGDAAAHLHLGLALDAAGDPYAARRAYAAARRALVDGDDERLRLRAEGYTTHELRCLLESRLEANSR